MVLGARGSDKRFKECCVCGEVFKTKPSHWERRKACSRKCDNKRRETMYLGKDNPNFENRGAKNPLFKGGRRVNSRGYVLVYHPEHPNCDQDGYVMEHRYIMSLHLGRPLEDWEVVHHKDHNKQNNEISNLEVMSLADHTRLHNEEKEIIRCEKTGRILSINVIAPVETAHFVEVDELSDSERGTNGYGSTGVK
ncbi:hypothetical protein BAU26_10125 [Bacillus sp. N35-10-4]|uniref:HNH endonuclease n=1 Tax=Bacillus sp. N35-10-4 TaxID=1866315 RepID=UPI0008FDCAF3|nr:HNH endonuclease [Bacillus sp. N35-10-4]OJD66230.1 hypothetical protein BAU26_10125 [Bacillus sp. N35-10-4]